MKNKQIVVLEPSTNTHSMTAESVIVTDLGGGNLKLKVEGSGIVTHGEHGVVRTEAPDVIKYVQQELNPITNAFQNAYD
tara:strand:- start:9498 stop:9734 length:237 start_codon:yes stop_codon:yes gene_type:complete